MRQPKQYISTLALAITLLLGVGTADARPPWQDGTPFGLSQEQQSEAQKAFAEQAQKMAPLIRQLQSKRAELGVLSFSDKPDENKVQSLFREIADIQAQLYIARNGARKELESKGIPFVAVGPGFRGMGGGQGMAPGYERMGERGYRGFRGALW